VDANLSWEATPKLSLAFAVDNLLDEDYEEAVGFPAVGLRARLAARYRFGG
jgi:outer membrane receptor protein involved in Fe transport